ncbi:MAG TPA: endonuclease [Sphingobacteriaceae bacterium]|nr:endonuclease [Sphingobacteriaceae bacterium]
MSRRRKSSLGFISKTMFAANILAVILLLLSYLATVINLADFWPIAFAGLAHPFLLLINLFFITYWLITLRPKIACMSVVVILIGWQFVLNQIGFRESAAEEAPKSSKDVIRVMTYNVHYLKTMAFINDPETREQMFDVIRREQPDVVCFQEFLTHDNKDIDTEKTMIEILQANHYYFVPFNLPNYEEIGLAIFSKLQIKNKGSILFPGTSRGNEAIYTDVEFNKKIFRVYNVHFQSIAFQPADYKFLKKVEDASPDLKSSRRIGSRLKNAFIKRSQQVNLLKKNTLNCRIPFIVAGDFNDTPVSYALQTMSKGLKNAFREKGSGIGITYNGDFPNFQIDYILTSPDFEIKNYRIIEKKLSDHYAVRSDVELK